MTRSRFHIGADEWPGISKLVEECGEVLQVCGKLIANEGKLEHWDGTNLRARLVEELADLIAAIRFVEQHAGYGPSLIEDRARHKLALFEKWHYEQAVAACGGCAKAAQFPAGTVYCAIHERGPQP